MQSITRLRPIARRTAARVAALGLCATATFSTAAGPKVNLTATIASTWWTNIVDSEGDGFFVSGRLHWDPDVSGTGSLNVYDKVYYKPAASSTWTLARTSSVFTITNNNPDDEFIDINDGFSHGLYDFKIEIYREGISTPDFTRDESDANLNDQKLEPSNEDLPLGPDLICSASGSFLAAPDAKNKRIGIARVQNVGNQPAGVSSAGVWFVPTSGSPVFLKAIKVSKLLPGALKDRKLNLKPPTGFTWSQGHAVIIVDRLEQVPELDESNNTYDFDAP